MEIAASFLVPPFNGGFGWGRTSEEETTRFESIVQSNVEFGSLAEAPEMSLKEARYLLTGE